jgi:HPt (histidine-containing phosphotransfer) domain-containing protein
MRNALDAGDCAELQRLAHSLKSNSASMGAYALSALAACLEERCKAGTLDDAQRAGAGRRRIRAVARRWGRCSCTAGAEGQRAQPGPARPDLDAKTPYGLNGAPLHIAPRAAQRACLQL